MGIKQRAPKPKKVDDFIDGADRRDTARDHGLESDLEQWQNRANTAKKTESQAFRYNVSQARLLAYAKRVEGRDYSKILAELVWKPLEDKYGDAVPLEDD